MRKVEIIGQLAREKAVEEIIAKVCKSNAVEMNDLAQDIYLDLLLKDEEKIQKLFDNQQLRFFVTKMVENNYFSVTSPFYSRYKKFLAKSEELNYGL